MRKKLLALVVLYAVNKHHSFCRKLSWIVGITTLKPLQVDRISHSAHQDPERAYIFRYLGHLSIHRAGKFESLLGGLSSTNIYIDGIYGSFRNLFFSTHRSSWHWIVLQREANSQMHTGWHCWYLHVTGQPLYFKVRVECIVFHYAFITLYQHHLMLVQYSEQLCSQLQSLI